MKIPIIASDGVFATNNCGNLRVGRISVENWRYSAGMPR